MYEHWTPRDKNHKSGEYQRVSRLCRDGVDTPMPPYIGKAFTRRNFEDLSLFRYMIMVCE